MVNQTVGDEKMCLQLSQQYSYHIQKFYPRRLNEVKIQYQWVLSNLTDSHDGSNYYMRSIQFVFDLIYMF